MKRSIVFTAFVCSIIISAGAQTPLTIYGLRGPSGIGMVGMFEDPPSSAEFSIRMEALASADLMAAKFLSGEAKVGILPPNVAAKLAAAGRPLQVAAVVGNGMLSLISDDPSIRSITDLRGKRVEVAGQGATPDFVFRKILSNYSMNPDRDLRLSYALAYPEIAQSLIAGRASTALLPEPFATMALNGKASLRKVGDIQAEWQKAGGSLNYPMTVLVIDRDFASTQAAVIRIIMDAYKESIEWVTENPTEAGLLVDKHSLGMSPAVAALAIPRSNYVFIPAREAKADLEALYNAFLEYAPVSIGGRLPADSFYLGQ